MEQDATTVQVGLGGHTNGSNRSEILWAIIGVAKTGPANVGIDRSSCFSTVNQLHNVATIIGNNNSPDEQHILRILVTTCKGNLRKPWSIQKNGDFTINDCLIVLSTNLLSPSALQKSKNI